MLYKLGSISFYGFLYELFLKQARSGESFYSLSFQGNIIDIKSALGSLLLQEMLMSEPLSGSGTVQRQVEIVRWGRRHSPPGWQENVLPPKPWPVCVRWYVRRRMLNASCAAGPAQAKPTNKLSWRA